MARQARGKSMDPAKVQVFHAVQRCVRRAFLCGEDTVSGKSYPSQTMDPRTFGILGVDLRNRFVDLHGVVKSPASSNEKSAGCGRSLE